MWHQWQEEMLLEADRLSVPMWAIAAEFNRSITEVINKLEWLKWRDAA
ncbi:hypothetical protein [Sporomusa paucivorans]